MANRDLVYLQHIVDHIAKIQSRIQGRSLEEFLNNEDLRVIVSHYMQIIGEAASRVTPDCRSRHAHVSWRAMIGMRNHVVHNYMGVNYRIIWEAAVFDLPALLERVQAILEADK